MKLYLDHLYEHQNPSILINEHLTIYIGNNGSGKTTILNMIYNILSSNFVPLFEVDFESAELILEVDDLNPDIPNYLSYLHKINVYKKNSIISVTYYLDDDSHYEFTVAPSHLPFFESICEVIYAPETELVNELAHSKVFEKLDSLIDHFPELQYNIQSLKNSLLYFPTYRRIDSDLVNMLEQNHNNRFEGDFDNIRKLFDSLPTTNKVVGINDDDIDAIFKKYSLELQNISTEGLNDVLKNLINQLIQSTYKYTDSKILVNQPYIDQKSSSETLRQAPEKLIQLAQQLQLDNVNENSIVEYFKLQKKYQDTEFDSKIKKSRDKKNEVTKREFEKLIFSLNGNNDLIVKLIESYSDHLEKLDTHLKSYEYLRVNFENFFKNRVSLNMDPKNYKIQLSKPFKDLSTGEKQILTILCYSALLKTSIYRALIIIDEPELSLHISWQNQLLSSLLSLPNNPKLIIATHSPYIAYDEFAEYMYAVGELDD